MRFFIVGKNKGTVHNGQLWSFEGLFDSEEKAKEVCTTDDHWLGPAEVNEFVGGEHEERPWPDAYYPTLEDGPSGG